MGADKDIVERLQSAGHFYAPPHDAILYEAAAEIVRLRGEVANGKFLADFAEAQQRRTPAPAMPNGVEDIDWPFTYIVPNSKHEYVPKHHAERKIREALRAADNRDAAGVEESAALYGMFRALVDAGGATSVARYGGEKRAEALADALQRGMFAIEHRFHPERFDEFPVGALAPAAVPAGEAVAYSVVQVGNRGAAYDPPNTHRAFTYEHQPGNIDASRLGRATAAAALASAGDGIDRGLSLLKELQALGFGVFQIGPPAPVQAAPQEGWGVEG